MRKRFVPVLVLVAGSALFLAGMWSGGRNASHNSRASQRQALYYVDPMNPAHTSDHPGLAPCGMKMEPVYAESESGAVAGSIANKHDPGKLRVSAERQQIIGVRVSTAQKVAVNETLRLYGRVVPDERRVYRLNAGAEGIIREGTGVTTGTHVTRDQLLATFSAPDTRTTIQGFLTAVDVVDRQRKSGANTAEQLSIVTENTRLAADRLQTLGLSPLQIEEIRNTREVPLALRIHAPADGVVLAQNATPGLKFEKGAEWFRIANLERVWVLADVFPHQVEQIQRGAEAQVLVPGERKTIPVRAAEVLPQMDPATRTLKLRLEVDNRGMLLRPEMFVDVLLPVTLPPAVMVSADSVLNTGLRSTVFVDLGNGTFEQREVEIGHRVAGDVEILSGIQPGEQIVTAGTFLLDSESRIQGIAVGLHDSSITDPVCGMKVDQAAAQAGDCFANFGGKVFYFCNDTCKEAFSKAPSRFAEAPRASAGEVQTQQQSLTGGLGANTASLTSKF